MRYPRRPLLAAVLSSAALFVGGLAFLVGLGEPIRTVHADDDPAKKAAPKKAPPQPPGFVLDATSHDFGIVEQNNEYAAVVGYRNTGSRTITKLKVKADCGCYAAAVSAPTLKPGEGGEVSIQFRTLSFRGVVNKTLSILYDDGGPKRATIKLRVRVFGGVLVDPGRVYFGEVLEGSTPEGAVDLLWYPDAGEPFEIKSIEVQGEPIETSIAPFEDKKKTGQKGWHVTFRFTKPPKRGVYSKKAIVHLTHPRTPKVRIPLTGHVVGKVWVQQSRVHLGLVAQGESKSAKVLLRHFDGKTPLTGVSAKASKGVLQVSLKDGFTPPLPGSPPAPAKILEVTVPEDAPVGALNDDVVVRTNVPGEERVVIQIRGRVFKRTGD